MVKEIKKGHEVTDGSVTAVVSTYDLGDEKFIKCLGPVECSVDDGVLAVASKYTDSVSFTVVTSTDAGRHNYSFTHVRKPVRPYTLDINNVAPTVRPKAVSKAEPTPSLEEINVKSAPLPRVGF